MKLAITIGLSLTCLASLVGCGSAPSDHGASNSAAVTVAEEGDSCGGFVAHPAQCDASANLYCKSNGVPDMPGTCTSCDGFGMLPHIAKVCADGTEASAHWVAKNGTCQIEVCPDTTNSSGSCQQASDCSGALPRNMVQCADGSFGGAQWDCVQNACTISYCDNNGGAGTSGGGGGSNSCNDFNPCPAGQTCINQTTGQPAVNGQGGACAPSAGNLGDACQGSSTDLTVGCASGLYCDPNSSTCMAQGNPGDACDPTLGQLSGGECASGVCDPNAGVCQ
jgi:hypothetical protein